MPQLPTLKWKPAPPGRAERLVRWFDEWNLVQKLRRKHPEFAEPLRPNRGPSGTPCPEPEPPVAPFDPGLTKGQIRLMDPLLFAEFQRPIYVALIAEWGPRAFITAPFGAFLEPATKTEWLTGRSEHALRVLCLWNVRTMPAEVLKRSWHVDDLTTQQLQDAWQVFRHATTGADLDDRLLAQVGCPIVHPRDPRIAYQQEEARQMAPLAVAASEHVCQTTPIGEEPPTLAQWLAELIAGLKQIFSPPNLVPQFGASGDKGSGGTESLKEIWRLDKPPRRCILYLNKDGDLLLQFSSTDDRDENQTFEVCVREHTRPTVTFRRDPEGELSGEVWIRQGELPKDPSQLSFELKKE